MNDLTKSEIESYWVGYLLTIMISKSGKNPHKVEESQFEGESQLQKFIFETPESIPLDKLKSDFQLFIAAREFKDVDHLGFDKDGKIFLIETKLDINTTKREIIAQVFDYGSKLWDLYKNDSEKFFEDVENNNHYREQHKLRFNEKLRQVFKNLDEEQVEDLIGKIANNIEEGKFVYLVVMDKLDDELKKLIQFLIEKHDIEIYAVEMKFYKDQIEDYEIMVPVIFGSELSKAKGMNRHVGKQWNEQSFFDDAKSKLNDEEFYAVKKMYDFLKNEASFSDFGSGITSSFNPIFSNLHQSASILRLKSDGSIRIAFHHLLEKNPKTTNELKEKLSRFLTIPDKDEPNFTIDQWYQHVDDIINVVKDLIK